MTYAALEDIAFELPSSLSPRVKEEGELQRKKTLSIIVVTSLGSALLQEFHVIDVSFFVHIGLLQKNSSASSVDSLSPMLVIMCISSVLEILPFSSLSKILKDSPT